VCILVPADHEINVARSAFPAKSGIVVDEVLLWGGVALPEPCHLPPALVVGVVVPLVVRVHVSVRVGVLVHGNLVPETIVAVLSDQDVALALDLPQSQEGIVLVLVVLAIVGQVTWTVVGLGVVVRPVVVRVSG